MPSSLTRGEEKGTHPAEVQGGTGGVRGEADTVPSDGSGDRNLQPGLVGNPAESKQLL